MTNFIGQAKAGFINLIKTRLRKNVTQATNILYLELVRRTSSGKYPDEITEAIRTSPAKFEPNKGIVGQVAIDLDIAPMALAFEFGSGIWAERGSKQKYPITPKNASILSFLWPEATNIAQREGVDRVRFTEEGRAFLPKVMHPGIQARPYIQPAIETKADEIAELLGDGFIEVLSEALGPDRIVIK
jgi:hypothetical protein